MDVSGMAVFTAYGSALTTALILIITWGNFANAVASLLGRAAIVAFYRPTMALR